MKNLKNLSRRDLQRLCKKHGIKANQKTVLLISSLQALESYTSLSHVSKPTKVGKNIKHEEEVSFIEGGELINDNDWNIVKSRYTLPYPDYLTVCECQKYEKVFYTNDKMCFQIQKKKCSTGGSEIYETMNFYMLICVFVVFGFYSILAYVFTVVIVPLLLSVIDQLVYKIKKEFFLWEMTESNFHGICSTLRGRLLHPAACALGAQESAIMSFACISIGIHWFPSIGQICFVFVRKLMKSFLKLFWRSVASLYSWTLPLYNDYTKTIV